jgi:DNA-binding response OmpR family regulator
MLRRNTDDVLPREAEILCFGRLQVDPEGFTATVNGEDLELTFGEFLLLKEFASHPYQVLDRERLSGLVRGGTEAADIRPSPRSVDTHVARLRAKLRAAGYNCIRTMRFVGYRFVPPDGAKGGSGVPDAASTG